MIIIEASKKAIACLSIFCSFNANAQNVILAPHKKPLSWTITYVRNKQEKNYEGESEKSLGNYSSISTLQGLPADKTKYIYKHPISLRTTYHENNDEKDYYYYEKIEISENKGQNSVYSTSLESSFVYEDQIFREKFPKVSWVTPEYYVGKVKAYDQECHYFKDGDPKKWIKGDNNYYTDMTTFFVREAWFSVQTGLPVAFKIGDEEGKYNFHNGEQAKVIVPARIKEEVNKYLRYKEYLRKRAEPAKLAPE